VVLRLWSLEADVIWGGEAASADEGGLGMVSASENFLGLVAIGITGGVPTAGLQPAAGTERVCSSPELGGGLWSA
jgi:hypothetical protein